MPISLLRRPEAIVVVALLLAMIGIDFVNPAFWSLDNQFGLLRSNIVIGIMALNPASRFEPPEQIAYSPFRRIAGVSRAP